MRNSINLAAAVAGVLAASAAGAYQLNMVYSGSSAAQGTFASVVSSACQAGTLTTYKSAGTTKNYFAYQCTLQNIAGLGAAKGETAIIYYRTDQGSVAGVGPLSAGAPGFVATKGAKINRLDDTSTVCGAAVAGVVTCTIGNDYNGTTDAVAVGLKKDFVNVGVSDLEPGAFTGENWGTAFASWIGNDPGKATLSAIPHQVVVGQVFELVTTNANVSNLSRQSVTNIFNGKYSDWSQVPTDNTGALAVNGHAQIGAATSAYPAGAIFVCRRDAGSGTQAGTSIIFENQGCSSSGLPFISPTNNPNGTGLQINASTGDMLTCLQNNANAIGYIVVAANGTLPAGVNEVTLDGIPADQTRAALGAYPWLFELTENKLSGSLPNADQNDFYTYITKQLAANATDPSSPNLVSIPNTTNSPQLPLKYSAVNHIPVALGTRGGDSCSPEVGQN